MGEVLSYSVRNAAGVLRGAALQQLRELDLRRQGVDPVHAECYA